MDRFGEESRLIESDSPVKVPHENQRRRALIIMILFMAVSAAVLVVLSGSPTNVSHGTSGVGPTPKTESSLDVEIKNDLQSSIETSQFEWETEDMRRDDKYREKPDTETETRGTSAYIVTITMDDFLKFSKVEDFIRSRGLSPESSRQELEMYIPRKIVIEGDPELIMGGGHFGSIGNQAMTGLTTWAMTYKNVTGEFTASYNIVVDMRGNIVAISPVFHALKDQYHFISFKPWPRNPRYILGGVDIDQTQVGPVYLWNWDSSMPEEYIEIGDGVTVDCHDVVWSFEEDSFWVSSNDRGVKKLDAATGDKLEIYKFEKHLVKDPNHNQFIDKDKYAIISSRVTNSFVKANLKTGELEWIAGGENGTLSIIDEDGALWPPGHTLWWGQHNVEYVGKGEYLLFDDQSSVNWAGTAETQIGEESRLLNIRIDEKKQTAKIVWSYPVGAWTPIYGDNDRMPNGNYLGAMWVGGFHCADIHDKGSCRPFAYDSKIMEVVKDTKKVAWRATIYGNSSVKVSNKWAGWNIYSAERIYKTPLVYNVKCWHKNSKFHVSFTTQNSIKHTNEAHGKYTILDTDGNYIYEGPMSFKPYWEQTSISAEIPGLATCTGRVRVTNEWGQTQRVDFKW